MKYKTKEQVMEELKKIDPKLIEKYDIIEINDGIRIGVQLKRGGTSIVSWTGKYGSSYGGAEGLYEIYPDMEGIGFRRRFGTTDDVAGWLTLEEAVSLAEATERVIKSDSPDKKDLEKLLELVKKYF